MCELYEKLTHVVVGKTWIGWEMQELGLDDSFENPYHKTTTLSTSGGVGVHLRHAHKVQKGLCDVFACTAWINLVFFKMQSEKCFYLGRCFF